MLFLFALVGLLPRISSNRKNEIKNKNQKKNYCVFEGLKEYIYTTTYRLFSCDFCL